MSNSLNHQQLLAENEQLRLQLEEASEAIQAIRTGQIDALVVDGQEGHELYTLRTADLTYRVIIETMSEGALTLDTDGLIVYGNSTFAAMVGFPLSQVIGVPLLRFVTEDCQLIGRNLLNEGHTDPRKGELTLANKQGNPIPCLLSITNLSVEAGASLSAIVTDLSAQKEAQHLLRLNNERLEKVNNDLEISNNALNLSNDNLQQFAYVASHDLQEPLRKIQSFGDLLKSNYASGLGADGSDMINRMGSAATRMSLLIKDLLNYSRLTTQQVPFAPVDLAKLLTDVLDDLSMAITESGAVIDADELPTVSGDRLQLRQLIQNLVANAIKFRAANTVPHVRLSVRQVPASAIPATALSTPLDGKASHRFYEISVTDNGIGFDEKYADRIFQVFQRLHGKTHYPGSGVGLAICRKVVFNHRGGLIAYSEPGKGARFVVYLPA